MRKGKCGRTKKYTTVMFVPHYSSRVKTVKFSSLHFKLGLIVIIAFAFMASLGLFFDGIIKENRKLKSDLTVLYSLNFEQKDMLVSQDSVLDNKNETIVEMQEEINSKDEFIKYKINEVLEKYKEVADTYIIQRIDTSLASRSSDRTNNAFAADINELKLLLMDLNDSYQSEQNENFDLSESTSKLEEYLSCIPTFKPTVGRISSYFGYRPDPITKQRRFHYGIDIAAGYGSDIRASGNGEVIMASSFNGYGNTIIIDHGFGISTLYGHITKYLVKEGDTVKKGDLIATVGSTGRSTGPHLHFEIRINDNPVDPMEFLDEQ